MHKITGQGATGGMLRIMFYGGSCLWPVRLKDIAGVAVESDGWTMWSVLLYAVTSGNLNEESVMAFFTSAVLPPGENSLLSTGSHYKRAPWVQALFWGWYLFYKFLTPTEMLMTIKGFHDKLFLKESQSEKRKLFSWSIMAVIGQNTTRPVKDKD